MQPKVSVIIPVYNVEKYIFECVMSVCNQTLKEIEIICVNDGTKDNSMEIISEIMKKDDRIVIVNKENGGLSSARNAGLAVAKGEYVQFLDSDDYLLEDTLETLYQVATENQLDDVLFDAEAFFETEEDAKNNKNYLTYYKRSKCYDNVMPGQELFIELYNNKDIRPSACLQMIRRELLLMHNISFYEGILHEDNLFSLQIYITAKRMKYISKNFYMRRVHGDSIMTRKKGIKSSIGYYVGEVKCIEFLQKHRISEEFRDILAEYLLSMQRNSLNFGKMATVEEVAQELDKMEDDIKVGYKCFIYPHIPREEVVKEKIVPSEPPVNAPVVKEEKEAIMKRVLRKLRNMIK